jgi:hypothetical protein
VSGHPARARYFAEERALTAHGTNRRSSSKKFSTIITRVHPDDAPCCELCVPAASTCGSVRVTFDFLREARCRTIATDLGVPRSTARGWLGAAPRVVVGLEVADLTEPELRQEILKVRRRVEKLAALLRLALALLHASGFSLLRERLPAGEAKARILSAMDRARECTPLTRSIASRRSAGWWRSTSTNTTTCFHIRRFEDRRPTRCTSAPGRGAGGPDVTRGRCAPSTRGGQPVGILRDVPVTQRRRVTPAAERRCDRELVRLEVIAE